MTNIEAKEKAVEIVRKYNQYVRFDYQAIKCAILQVKAIIEEYNSGCADIPDSFIYLLNIREDYQQILSELEKM